ncbi:MAG TPA: hypothetical protein VGG74_18830 [Kofleriaceae bacterium]|jgi:hypothetical protein
MRIHHLILAALVLATTASASADPRLRRVVILDFSGPRTLADAARSTVVTVLDSSYDVVATKRWLAAKMANDGRGPMQWSMAAKSAGVDAVLEGWVDPDGMRTHSMTVAVRDATTGRQLDTVSVRISDTGQVSDEAQKKLTKGLDELLTWVGDDNSSPPSGADWIPPSKLGTKGAHVDSSKPSSEDGDDDDDDDDDDGCDDDRRDRHHHRRDHHRRHHRDDDCDDRAGRDSRHGSHRDEDDRDERRDDPRDDRHDDDKHEASNDDKKDSTDKATTTVATADQTTASLPPETANVIDIFGPDAVETKIMTGKKDPLLEKPSPRFELSLGAFVANRSMNFAQDPPDYPATPPSYPGQNLAGVAISAAVYPWPEHKTGVDLSGLGGTFQLQKSIGATISANDTVNDTYGDYTLDFTSWEAAVHYRHQMGIMTLDAQVNYGRSSYQLESDFPSTVQIPDVQYEYLGAGGDLELAVTDRVRIGAGGRYMYIISAGDVSDEEWYGSGTASGLELNLNFKIPVTDIIYIRGAIEYRRVSMDFDGDGNLSTPDTGDDSLGVSNITDSWILGTVQVGASF